jgi:hypothetical protein
MGAKKILNNCEKEDFCQIKDMTKAKFYATKMVGSNWEVHPLSRQRTEKLERTNITVPFGRPPR